MTKTSAEYASEGGQACPVCGSHNLDAADQVDLDGDTGTQTIQCLNCKSEWVDVWHVAGYINLKVNR